LAWSRDQARHLAAADPPPPSYAATARYWLKLAARLKPGVSIEQAARR